jgi:serine/arginine repetitive matrix protein 1
MSTYRQPFSRGAATFAKRPRAASSAHAKLADALKVTIDVGKVDLDAIKPWISREITALLGVEDEVLIGMIAVLLEEREIHKNGAHVYAQLESFLEKQTETFCARLWELLASAQANAGKHGRAKGVPSEFMKDAEAQRKREDAAYERMKKNQERGRDGRRSQKPYDRPARGDSRDRGRRDRYERRRDSRSPPRRRSRWGADGERSDGAE